MNVEILSIRLGEREPFEWVECGKQRFFQALRPYAYKAHYHAANLAAHGWDVLLVDGRLFVGSPGGAGTYKGPTPSGHWVSEDFARTDATEEELALLYRPGERLFPLTANGMSAGTAETAEQSQREARQPGADRHSPTPSDPSPNTPDTGRIA